MHVSLDSALGRQRRLNSVGESVLQIAPNASAAYSLRSLTGGDPKVVRVRRASDNGERDFTSSDVTSGEMLRWVNAQAIKPLDIQALQPDGRTGDFLIAKAAYSLRSLGTRQATLAATNDTVARANDKFVAQVRRNVNGDLKSFTATEVTDGTLTSFVNESFTSSLPLDVSGSASAAYGLRNLSSTYSGDVVEVRRSSDDTLKSFKASEVTDGTLLAFVNEDVELFSNDFETNTSGFTLNTGGSNVAVRNTSDGFSGSGCLQLNLTSSSNSISTIKTDTYMQDTDGVTYTVSFYAKAVSGSANLVVKIGTESSSVQQISFSENGGEWVKHSLTFVNNFGAGAGNRNQRILFAGSTNNTTEWRIDDFKIVQTTANGHVSKWYDQSGNSKDAVQATAAEQPKIVDAGVLIKRNNNPAVESTSVNSLSFTLDSLSADGQQSVFAVLENDVTAQDGFGDVFKVNSDTGTTRDRRPHWFVGQVGSLNFSVDSTSGYQNSDRDRRLYSHIMNNDAGGTSTIYKDGTQVDTRSITLDTNTTFLSAKLAGVTSNATGSLYMSEVIYYPSDQSDKRRAIEESISGHYGITLPSFNRDGFVKTWYDQSVTNQAGDTATGNHAVQATAANQPKIVNDGSFLNELDFDGTDDTLAIDFGANLSQANSIFMVHQSDTTTEIANEFFDSVNGGVGERTLLDQSGGNYRMLSGSTVADTGFAITTDKSLVFALYNGSSSLFAKNGTATSALNAGTVGVNQNANLGSSFSSRFYNGTMQEFIIYNSNQTDNRTAIEANIGEAYSITGIPAYDNTVDGFVETWYDQSGNSNDAVQATAGSQPKIVNAGALVADNGIDLDGSQFLQANSFSGMGATVSMITASVHDSGGGGCVSLASSASGTTNFGIIEGNSVTNVNSRNTTSVTASASVSGVTRLSFALTTGQTSTKSGALGGTLVENTSDYGDDFTSGELNRILIGKLRVSSGTLFNGRIREALIYNTDESDNRTAIEANIANHYNITLV